MILLINTKTTKPSEVQTEYFREPNLGILYLAAILDKNNFPVDILDLEQFYDLDNEGLEDLILNRVRNYDVIGITTLTNTFYSAIKIAKLIKEYDSQKFLILGGPHVSFQYEEIIQQYPFIDFICIGEAENSFLELITNIITFGPYPIHKSEIDKKLAKIKGLAFKDTDGTIIFTGFPKPVEIEKIPLPARYLLPQENYYYRIANVIINRGCPNQCSFCSRQNLFRNVRIRNLESIKNEILDIISFQTYHYINFYDNININKHFFEQFCRMFIENHITIPWGCELRVDSIAPEHAKLLKEAGCRLVASGIESASLEVLKQNLKFQHPDKVRDGIKHLKKVGIPVQLYFILGLPGETQITVQQTLEFIKSLPLTKYDTINYFAATPYPGSLLWEEKERYQIKINEMNFSKYDCQHIIFETKDLDFKTLKELYSFAKEIEDFFN
ncbi:MAG: B12-binding domain-containing radical SAM protein [Candidatus Thorarchaeota archaeon]